MLKNVIGKLLGSANDRIIKNYDKTVSLINDLEPKYHAMSDDELRAQTVALRERLQKGEREKDVLPDAFALVREAHPSGRAVRRHSLRGILVQGH